MEGPSGTGVFPKRRLWPARYFISHSYKDKTAREILVSSLPKSVRAFIFKQIDVTPEQRVSDDLIDAVSRSHGLIYLAGGASAASFWVAFERRMALRAGKPIVAFDPQAQAFSMPHMKLVDPPCSIIWNGSGTGDTEIVTLAAEWLMEKRGLDLAAARNHQQTNAGLTLQPRAITNKRTRARSISRTRFIP